MNWLTKFLFTHTRSTSPDHRPLYAYKINEATYKGLKKLCYQEILAYQEGRLAPHLAPIFCLYAAETFCREYTEGPWAWEIIFKPLALKAPPYQQITEWVEKGLSWWRRPLLRNKGNRLFLVTIACEGGLPLRLLQQENAHLTKFFRAVLENYYRTDQSGKESAETIARQQAVQYLPRSLCQEPVFYLAATLIAKIGELHSKIGEVADPIAALDQQARDWRRDLPLRLDDQATETLLTGLVRRFGEIAREAGAQLRWRGQLRETITGWQIEKSLELPEYSHGEQIAEWISSSATDRPRWCLLLHTSTDTKTVAWLTRIQGEGKSARYRREWLRHGGVTLNGSAVKQSHRLSLYDGQREYPLTVRNGEPWGDAPWIFVERGTDARKEWLTEGSTRTRSEQTWVLAMPNIAVKEITGTCECLGSISELNQTVYRIIGEIELLTPQQDRYRIVCQAENDSEETFVVVGDTIPQAIQERPLYRGIPHFQALNQEGRRQPTTGRIQWRPVGDVAHWREIHETARGHIWLHLIDASGAERCRRQIDVVPPDFRIEAEIGAGNQPGILRLTGLFGANVKPGPDMPADISINHGAECILKIVCPPLPGILPPPLTLWLDWPGSQPLKVELPYPQRGALFQLAGQPLSNDAWVPLDRLGGLHLCIQDPDSGHHFWLEGELTTHAGESAPYFHQKFYERLPFLEQGRLDVLLLPWQNRIASLLANALDLDAQVHLAVKTNHGETLAKLRISRFDAAFEPNRAARTIHIPQDSLARLDPQWESKIRVEIIRLWAPTDTPITLSVNPNQLACWELPTDLEPGPWWIVGRDGDWARFRPLLWVASGNTNSDEDDSSSLAGAIRESNPERREQRLNQLIEKLGRDPDHPDWLRLFEYIGMAREFPPSSLDVLRRLPSCPLTLALALFKADDETFDSVWSLSRQMPFLWVLLPVNSWLNAAIAYFGGLQTALAQADIDVGIAFDWFQKFRERAKAHRPYWLPLCDWLQERLFPNQPLKNSELSMARRSSQVMEYQIERAEQELQGRHVSGEKWPESSEVMGYRQDITPEYRYDRLDRFYQPVRCVPFVAAHVSLNGIIPNERLIYEMRLLRAFDREWFDSVHAIALTLGLAQRPVES